MLSLQILPKELGGKADLQPVEKFVASLPKRQPVHANGSTKPYKDDDAPIEDAEYSIPDGATVPAQSNAALV